jgi:[ribosomal protein S18]-alanine N-acetyltransferase
VSLAADLARTHALAFQTDRAWSEAEFDSLLAAPSSLFTGDATAFVLGRVVLDEAEILTVATDPAHRRGRLATAALAAFETQAKAQGAVTIFLEVAQDNLAACQLYANAGFGQVGRRAGYYHRASGPSVAALVLQKSLIIPRIDSPA